MKFTKEQQSAIDTINCDLLVSAAAGSGKTAVLVERIIHMITDADNPVDIDKLLVVTFTEAAASEMRQRIAKALNERLKFNPRNVNLKKQLMLLHKASIMTIHSFCLSVARQYFHDLDIDPGFRVADITEIDLLKIETVRELFEDLYEDHYTQKENAAFPAFIKLAEIYGDKIKDDSFQALVLDLFEFTRSSPWPERWLREQAEAYHMQNGITGSRWYAFFKEDTSLMLGGVLESLKKAAAMACNPNIHTCYSEALGDDIEHLTLAVRALDSSFDSFYAAMFYEYKNLSGAKSKTMDGTMTDEDIKALKERIKTIRDEIYKKSVTRIREKVLFKPPADMEKDLTDSCEIMRALSRVVIKFSEKFAEAKRTKNIADFSDFEHFCLRALIHSDSTEENIILTDAAYEMQAKFHEVLTDEYQDSNLIQELILSAVSGKGCGARNRFMVGDIKQSIYKFRMANPDLFRRKYAAFSRTVGAEERLITLSMNFRSKQNVLDSINFVFKQLMTPTVGEVQYDKEAYLYYGANYTDSANEQDERTEICIIDSAGSETEPFQNDGEVVDEYAAEDIELIQELSKMEIEAKITAMRIRELVTENKFQVTQKDGGYRDIAYRDIVILLRSMPIAEVFAREMKSIGIPSFSGAASEYFEATEVMSILALLQIIDNPRQDIHLITVLHSPMFSFTADELVEMRSILNKGTFYDCVTAYAEHGNGNALKARAAAFLEKLAGWRDLAVYTPISELILGLYDDTGYHNYVGALQSGNIRQANLMMLFERAVQYEETSLKGLFHFIRYIEKLQKNKSDLGDAKVLSENENLVRIMSIHKSKGLEFPVVFVCGLGRMFNMMDSRSKFIIHKDLGFGSQYLDLETKIKSNTFSRYVISRKIIRESLSEELRILYVALTRAREKLILIGTAKDFAKQAAGMESITSNQSPEIPPYALMNKSCYLDWLIQAIARHSEFANIAESFELPQNILEDNSRWQINVRSKADVIQEEQKTVDMYAALFKQIANIDTNADHSGHKNEVTRRLSFKYPHKSAADAPSKMSVSEVKRMYYREFLKDSKEYEAAPQYVTAFEKPEFIKNETAPDAASKGTIMHTVLEHIDFNLHTDEEKIATLVDELVQRNILTAADTESVDINTIAAFMNAPIANRMRQSENLRREVHFAIGVTPSYINSNWSGIENEEMIVHGVIDCMFEENGEMVLVDYKTDRIDSKNSQSMAETADKYRLQLALYKTAIEKNTGKKVAQSILYFFSIHREFML